MCLMRSGNISLKLETSCREMDEILCKQRIDQSLFLSLNFSPAAFSSNWTELCLWLQCLVAVQVWSDWLRYEWFISCHWESSLVRERQLVFV